MFTSIEGFKRQPGPRGEEPTQSWVMAAADLALAWPVLPGETGRSQLPVPGPGFRQGPPWDRWVLAAGSCGWSPAVPELGKGSEPFTSWAWGR